MAEARPKLVILEGPNVPAAELLRALGDRYDVTVLPPGTTLAALHDGPSQADHARRPLPQLILGEAGTLELAANADRRGVEIQSLLLLNAIGDGVCLTRADGLIVWANARFATLDPPTQARVSGVCREASRWFVERPSGGTGGGAGASDGPQAPTSRRFEVANGDGTRYFEVVVSPVIPAGGGEGAGHGSAGGGGGAPGEALRGGGRVDRLAAVVRDVTAARRVQQKMDAIDQAGSELVRLEVDAVRKMNVVERLRLLETKIVNYSRDLLHFDHFAIRLTDERTGKLELVISSGLPREAMELDLYASREGNGISGHVATTGRSYICPDTRKDDRYLPGLTGALSSLTVPLRLHDRVIGIFNVESQRSGAFGEDDRQFAEIFARYTAMALHMLDLLVVERSTTNQTISGTVQGELSEPLQDIILEAEHLTQTVHPDPETARHIERIKSDVEAIRRRVQNVASGPQTLLGVERAMADRSADPIMQGRRVLVADDEARIRRIIGDVLRHRGCEVVVCEDGAKAITALEAARASGRHFDLVISDIKMPDRNGYEVFAAARRLGASLPVILMTGFGYDPHHSIVRASQEGMQSVLFKPFEVERMLDEVRKALTNRGTMK